MLKKVTFKNSINKWVTVPLVLLSMVGAGAGAGLSNIAASADSVQNSSALPEEVRKESLPKIPKATTKRINPPSKLHWVKANHQCQLYTGLTKNGTMYHPVKTIRPGYNDTFHLSKIIIMHAKNGNVFGRYQIRYNGNTYYATTLPYYMQNCYYQPKEAKGHSAIRVILPCAEYRQHVYSNTTRIRYVHRGQVIGIKSIVPIGRDYQFRFVMDNGDYVTANKNFVQLI